MLFSQSFQSYRSPVDAFKIVRVVEPILPIGETAVGTMMMIIKMARNGWGGGGVGGGVGSGVEVKRSVVLGIR
jgi:hypothetical protein